MAITLEELHRLAQSIEMGATIEAAATVLDYEAPGQSARFALAPGTAVVIELRRSARTEELPRAPEPDRARPIEPLTPRELDVLELVAEGISNRAIAERLGISEHTAKFHVGSLLGKLDAATRAELVVAAVRRGLIMI